MLRGRIWTTRREFNKRSSAPNKKGGPKAALSRPSPAADVRNGNSGERGRDCGTGRAPRTARRFVASGKARALARTVAEEPGLPPYAEQLAAFKAEKGVGPHDTLITVTFTFDGAASDLVQKA
jgi:hypothetical protein